ncbi:hypothetical protein NDU88_000297 [Pleurodeles waltl]|uniref:Uncharacterized protein n=1 Tax=Pleurodeles waltl TaxID=8319 RepID=A0AAV7S589_PLEWA|nr:hypothetical protein NDU88_000297 [Pleurodeles waltl]
MYSPLGLFFPLYSKRTPERPPPKDSLRLGVGVTPTLPQPSGRWCLRRCQQALGDEFARCVEDSAVRLLSLRPQIGSEEEITALKWLYSDEGQPVPKYSAGCKLAKVRRGATGTWNPGARHMASVEGKAPWFMAGSHMGSGQCVGTVCAPAHDSQQIMLREGQLLLKYGGPYRGWHVKPWPGLGAVRTGCADKPLPSRWARLLQIGGAFAPTYLTGL